MRVLSLVRLLLCNPRTVVHVFPRSLSALARCERASLWHFTGFYTGLATRVAGPCKPHGSDLAIFFCFFPFSCTILHLLHRSPFSSMHSTVSMGTFASSSFSFCDSRGPGFLFVVHVPLHPEDGGHDTSQWRSGGTHDVPTCTSTVAMDPTDGSWQERAVQIEAPELGCHVDVLGVAHVSATSAKDAVGAVRGEGARVRADAVVLELDAHRLRALLERETWRMDSREETRSSMDVLRRWAELGTNGYATRLVHFGAQAVLGAEPGGELRAAYRAAKEAGAMVVLGDRPASVTLQRMAARGRTMNVASEEWEHLQNNRPERSNQNPSQRETMEEERQETHRWENTHQSTIETKSSGDEQLIKAAERAGCSNAREAMKALQRMFRKGSHEPIVTSDLREVRKCANAAIEHMRDKALVEVPSVESNFRTTLLEERNLILAKAIKDTCKKCSNSQRDVRVVAVVGASHVPGIQKEWEHCDTPEALAKISEYNQSVPYDVVSPRSSYALLGLGALGAVSLARRFPKLVVRGSGVIVGSLLVAGGVALHGVVQMEKQLQRLADASQRLKEEEEMGFWNDSESMEYKMYRE